MRSCVKIEVEGGSTLRHGVGGVCGAGVATAWTSLRRSSSRRNGCDERGTRCGWDVYNRRCR